MNQKLKSYYEKELSQYNESLKKRDFQKSWHHIERAHILSQFFWREHFYVHCKMFSLALKSKNTSEILGQIPRLILAIPGSIFKKAPKGNIGSSRVGIFEPMEVPEDLKSVLDSNSTSEHQ